MDDLIIASLRDVSYRYPEAGNPALDGVTLEVRRGEWLALLGSNGSGKSTLAKHLNALLVPMQGACFICGLDTREESNLWKIRRQVAMVFQNPENQIVSTVVEDDTAFGPENLGLSAEEIVRRVTGALEVAGLSEKRHSASYTLSGGQKQRLAIAGALAMGTSCIVLDEPTAMLDPQGRREVMSLLKSLNKKGITVIHITHRLEEIIEATRAVIMDKGKILWQGEPVDLFEDSRLASWGLELPPLAGLWQELKSEGLIRGEYPPDIESMVNSLCQLKSKI